MEFKVLGSVEVLDDNGPVMLGGPQQRKVLAVMLCEPGKTLTYERLVEVLWPAGEPPESARRTAITYISRLRAALGDGWITTSDAGYSLEASAASIDAQRFTALVESARSLPPVRALDALDEALALWRGPVFGDLHSEWWAVPTVSRLDELRLAAFADRIDALSASGWDGRALAEIQSLVASYPLRSAFVERLMNGLRAAGRTDEALRAFQRHRAELIERTGLDPSPVLVELDRSIAESGAIPGRVDEFTRALRGYVLHDVIGEGSFGTVYRATQPGVARDVAVKVVKPELADDRSFIHRFEAEAQLVARLEHPHIVPLYDFWREPGGAYLVFRLLRGGTAEQALIAEGPFSEVRATRLLEQIGGALASAHASGIVHRDVKPANILFDEDGSGYLADFGIATARRTDELTSIATAGAPTKSWSVGSPMYASPEQARDGLSDARADQYALAATVWELLTGHPPFEGGSAAEVVASKLRAPLAPVRLLRPELPQRIDDVLRRASAVHPDDRFDSVTDFVAAWQAGVVAGLTTTTANNADPVTARGRDEVNATALALVGAVANPYKGLRPFGEADASEFFGRSLLVEQLLDHVAGHRFTAVVGPSGSGKSSVVLAGVAPALKRSGSLVVTLTPGADPFGAMAGSLTEIATADQVAMLSETALRAPGGLVGAVSVLAEHDELVIVIDQLEELWTASDLDDRTAFVAALAHLDRSSARARVIATVRADWFDRPLRDPSLGPLVARATFGVTPMSATELHEAVIEPAEKVGVRFEAGLVGRIVSEALDQPAPLPLLQVALTELFDRRSGATISNEVYEEIGGLAGSVAHQAEAVYATFAEVDRMAARRLFARLVTAGDGSEDTRRRARYSELTGIPDDVVTALVERRLLTVDRDRDSREPTIEVAHEALLRSWPRLRHWLDEDRDWLRELRALAGATRLWASSGRDDADLYRGARLAVIGELVRDRAEALTPDESEFLVASQSLVDAERFAIEDRARLRELQNRRLRRSLVGLGVVVVAALFAGGIAVVQSRRADDAAASANEQAVLAEQRSAEAAALSVEADNQRDAAEEQRHAADRSSTEAQQSEEVARAAERRSAVENLVSTSILQRGNRQDLAALLAIEAYRIDREVARSALFSTFTRNFGFVGYRSVDDAEAIMGVVLTADGTSLAALDGGRLARLDLETDTTVTATVVDTLDPGGEPYDRGALLRLSGDGRIVVLAVQGSDALMWRAYDAISGRPLTAPVRVPFAIVDGSTVDPQVFQGFGDASLTDDGSLFAISGGSAGRVLVFSTADGALAGTLSSPPPAGWSIPSRSVSVLFGPDGALFVGGVDGSVLMVDPASVVNGSLRVVRTIEGTEWGVELGLRLSDGGDHLITFGSGAVSRIALPEGTTDWWTLAGSENLLTGLNFPLDYLIPCRDVAVDSGRERFYCDDEFGSIFEHDAATGARTARSFDRQTGLTASLALSADGRDLIASSFTSDSLAVWRLDGSGPVQRRIASDAGSFATWGYSADGSHLIASGENLLYPAVWNAVTGKLVDPLEGFLLADWSPVADQLWVAAGPQHARYDITTGELVPGISIDQEGGFPATFDDSAHDRVFLMWDHQIKGFDQAGQYVGPTIAPPSIVEDNFTSVWSTPDGTALVVSSIADGTHLYDATTGARLDASGVPLMRSVVGRSGVAIGSTLDGRLYQFDPYTLELQDELPGAHGYAEEMYLSDDESILVVGNESDSLRIYDVRTRTQIGDGIPYLDGSIGLASLRPDGMELAIASGDLGVVIWDLDPAHWLDAACALAGRNLTQTEWDLYIGDLAEYHESCVGGRAKE